MSTYEQSPGSKELRLKNDLDRLFSPEFSAVTESSEWTIFLGRSITRQFYLTPLPETAFHAALDGFKMRLGRPMVSFNRYQSATRLLGREKITYDRVILDVTDYHHDGGLESEHFYDTAVDMMQSAVTYDDRLANVVKACLDDLSVQIKE